MSSNARSKASEPIADSWEDDAEDSSPKLEQSEDHNETFPTTPTAKSHPKAPPPTPMAPHFSNISNISALDSRMYQNSTSTDLDPQTRPEKTTSTASRMIAAGLGVKAPKRTEDQKKYDQAMRDTERRKREKERESKKKLEDEAERQRAEIWDG